MPRRVLLSVAWLLVVALVAPSAPIAEEAVLPEAAEVAPATPPAPAPETVPTAPPDPSEPPPAPAPPVPAPETGATEPVQQRSPRPRAFAAAPGSVVVEDFSFAPSAITVGVGDSVTWRNDGPSAHTATATDGSFDTGLLDTGESGSATFDEAGTFSYLCEPHPFMKGTVRVVAQSASGDGGDGGGGSTDGGTASDPSDAQSTAGTTDAAQGEALPETGSEPLRLALTGLGLLAIGLVGRRRAVT